MKKFTLIELLVVVSIIGILSSILLPSLHKARLSAQSAVCKSNLNQIYITQILYGQDNGDRIMATTWGAEWPSQRTYKTAQGSWVIFHDGTKDFLEPYGADRDSEIFKCPATIYDPNSRYYQIDKGRSYEGFLDRNNRRPLTTEELFVGAFNQKIFENASRKPFIFDYTAPLNNNPGSGNDKQIGNSSVHGNTGKINLLVSDGNVVPMNLPVQFWSTFRNNNWTPYLELAVGESAN